MTRPITATPVAAIVFASLFAAACGGAAFDAETDPTSVITSEMMKGGGKQQKQGDKAQLIGEDGQPTEEEAGATGTGEQTDGKHHHRQGLKDRLHHAHQELDAKKDAASQHLHAAAADVREEMHELHEEFDAKKAEEKERAKQAAIRGVVHVAKHEHVQHFVHHFIDESLDATGRRHAFFARVIDHELKKEKLTTMIGSGVADSIISAITGMVESPVLQQQALTSVQRGLSNTTVRDGLTQAIASGIENEVILAAIKADLEDALTRGLDAPSAPEPQQSGMGTRVRQTAQAALTHAGESLLGNQLVNNALQSGAVSVFRRGDRLHRLVASALSHDAIERQIGKAVGDSIKTSIKDALIEESGARPLALKAAISSLEDPAIREAILAAFTRLLSTEEVRAAIIATVSTKLGEIAAAQAQEAADVGCMEGIRQWWRNLRD